VHRLKQNPAGFSIACTSGYVVQHPYAPLTELIGAPNPPRQAQKLKGAAVKCGPQAHDVLLEEL